MSEKEKNTDVWGGELNRGFCVRCGGYVLGKKGECRSCELYDLEREKAQMYSESITSARRSNKAHIDALLQIAEAIRGVKKDGV